MHYGPGISIWKRAPANKYTSDPYAEIGAGVLFHVVKYQNEESWLFVAKLQKETEVRFVLAQRD